MVHDLVYWRGGTCEARLTADLDLRSCVLNATSSETIADFMFAGVRLGGGPYYPAPFRWGYGWPFGRFYKPLTPNEEALADSLEEDYLLRNPPPAREATAARRQ